MWPDPNGPVPVPDPSADPSWLYAFVALLGCAFLGFVIGWIARQVTLPIE